MIYIYVTRSDDCSL